MLSLTQQENPFILGKTPEILFLLTSCSTVLDDSVGSSCFCRAMGLGGNDFLEGSVKDRGCSSRFQ